MFPTCWAFSDARIADPGGDFDPGFQELGLDQIFDARLALRHHGVGRLVGQIAGLAVDEQVLLLHADGKGRFLGRLQ
jgi:hypothetical protein